MDKHRSEELMLRELRLRELDQDIDVEKRIITLSDEIAIFTGAYLINRIRTIETISGDPETPITLEVSSYGGEVYGCLAVIDVMRTAPMPINTLGLGACMSAGALILLSGTGERSLTKNSIVMLHQISSWASGKIDDIEVQAKHTKKLQSSMEDILVSRSKKDKAFWKKQMSKDLYLTADECLKYGIIDRIV